MVYSDESFLPQIVGSFYATFDPKLGPTVLHQVPENLITSTSLSEEARSRSTSASRSTSPRGRANNTSSSISTTLGTNHTTGSNNHNHNNNHNNTNGNNRNGRSRSRQPPATPSRRPRSLSVSRSTSPGSSASSSSSRTNTPTLIDFAPISDYVIPKKSLYGKLVTSSTAGEGEDPDGAKEQYRVMGFPSVLTGEGGRYQRNEYMWNLCFVFHSTSSLEAFEPVVRKCARISRSAELDSAYSSSPAPDHLPLPAVSEQLFEDLNSYSETSINLDGFNSLELKSFPFFPNPPDCEDWHVPVASADINASKDDNWDITAARVAQHIDGVNHVARIAQSSDADEALTRETLRHMLYYQVIMMIDIFQYSNMYTLKPAITRLSSDPTIIAECGPYVTRPAYPRASWPALLRLYSKLLPGVTVHEWIERNNILAMGIDPRRFVSFGIIKGFLRRVHRWPVSIDRTSPTFTTAFESADHARRRVEFDKSTRVDSSLASSARTGTNTDTHSQSTRSGPGDSTFTLRSQGSNMSLGVSPGRTPSSSGVSTHTKSPRRGVGLGASTAIYPIASAERKDGTSHSAAVSRSYTSGPSALDSGIVSSRKTPTGMLRAGTALKMRHAAAGEQIATRSFEEIVKLCDGAHHSDEIQVRFGVSWKDLERISGLDGVKDGKGRKGVVVVFR